MCDDETLLAILLSMITLPRDTDNCVISSSRELSVRELEALLHPPPVTHSTALSSPRMQSLAYSIRAVH